MPRIGENVFYNPDSLKPWTGDGCAIHWERARKSAGHEWMRIHDLRHTFGALKIEQGENIYYIQRQMGHSSIQVTIDIYGHLLETRKPEAAAKTDELVFGR